MRIAPAALVSAGLVVAGVVIALLVLRDDGPPETAILPTRTSATMIPVTPVDAPTPRPEETEEPAPSLVAELPTVTWTAVDPSEISEATWHSAAFLLDTETGEIYSPVETLAPYEGQVGVGLGWAANGDVVVYLYEFAGAFRTARYSGPALGQLRELPGWMISARGMVAVEDGFDNVLLDAASDAKVTLLPPRPWRIHFWSPDGRYLSLEKSEIGIIPGSAIWDSETRRIAIEVPGVDVRWSNDGKFFLYTPARLEGRDIEHLGLRLVDVGSSTERVIPDALTGWSSPDGRFLVVDGTAEAPTSSYDFRIFDLVQDKYILTLRGAWPDAWFDSDTLGLTGNVCDTYDYFTIDVDGSNLRRIGFDEPRSGIGVPSGQRDRMAYSGFEGSRSTVRVLSLVTGQTRDYETGAARLYAFPGGGSQVWSPDGRYLVVYIPPGKGGLCEFEAPRPLQVQTP